MKKLMIATLILGSVAAVSSCTKDYTCECTILGFTGDTTLVDVKKSEAKDYCDDQDAAAALFGGSCDLK